MLVTDTKDLTAHHRLMRCGSHNVWFGKKDTVKLNQQVLNITRIF